MGTSSKHRLHMLLSSVSVKSRKKFRYKRPQSDGFTKVSFSRLCMLHLHDKDRVLGCHVFENCKVKLYKTDGNTINVIRQVLFPSHFFFSFIACSNLNVNSNQCSEDMDSCYVIFNNAGRQYGQNKILKESMKRNAQSNDLRVFKQRQNLRGR